MAQETAVEWLVNELEKHHVKIDLKNTVAFNTAKQMEKDQIVDAWHSSHVSMMTGEQYYNETYESNT